MAGSVDFGTGSAKFLQWFRAQEGATFHPALELTDLRSRNAGRGIIAKQDIPAETDLFTIPRQAIICVETSDLAQKLPELFTNSSVQDAHSNDEHEDDSTSTGNSDAWLNLILAMLYESMHLETSKWAPYLRVLPSLESQFDTLMFWSHAELSELQASALVGKIGKESADIMFREKILPIVKQHSETFLPKDQAQVSDEELIRRCHIIGSLIMSYAFDLQPEEDDDAEDENGDGWIEDSTKQSTMGMVPMADMLNADAEFNAHLSHGEDALTMTSLRPIEAGEEVLNYYGPLPTGELLRRYGYTSPKHARYDVVELEWTFVKNVLANSSNLFSDRKHDLEKHVTQIEEEEGLDDSDGFLLEREAGDPDEEGLFNSEAKFVQFPEDLVSIVSALVQEDMASQSEKRKQASDSTESLVKLKVLRVLEEIVLARAAQYTTSMESDEALISSGSTARRTTMAVEVRVGEKRLLSEVETWLKEKQLKYSQTQDQTNGGQKTSKRLKR